MRFCESRAPFLYEKNEYKNYEDFHVKYISKMIFYLSLQTASKNEIISDIDKFKIRIDRYQLADAKDFLSISN